MNRREASKKETKRLIVKAARILFAQKGMEDCTLREIAKKAGVSPASVVVHFKNKTGLLEEALGSDLEKTVNDLIASMPDGTMFDRVMYLSKGFFALYETNKHLYRALICRTVFEPVSETPHITRTSEQYVSLLSGMIEAEKRRGTVKPTIDSTVAAICLFSLYMGALIMFFRTPEMTVKQVLEYLSVMTQQYLAGIMSRE